MFSAPSAGSGAGDVGPGSSPISHLSETMRALLDTSPVRAARLLIFQNREGAWGGGLGRMALGARVGAGAESQGETRKPGSLCPLPFPSPPHPLPFCQLFLIFGN